MALQLERANSSRRIGPWSLLGLVLIPLLVAGGFLWATWDSDTRLTRVEAAVVNLDEMVKVNGQPVPLGRQLAGGLVADNDDRNFSWVLTDEQDASDGLESGRYAAVVTIPEDFSRRATSFSKSNADQVEPATLDVQTSDITGIADPVVGQAVTAAATRAMNSSLTEQYLQNIYLGFNRMGKQFGTVADAAGKLSGGADQLAHGLDGASSGSEQLADGLVKLDSGTSELAVGARRLSSGVSGLSTGLGTLAEQTSGLPAGARKLATGASSAAEGSAELASGARKLDRGMEQFTAGTRRNAKGTAAYAAGVSDFSDGLDSYAGGADQFAKGLKQYRDRLAGFKTMSAEQLSQVVPCPPELPQETCPAFYAGLQAGTGIAVQGLADSSAPSGTGLLSGAQGLASGADKLAAGGDKLAAGAQQLSDGAATLDTSARKLASGVDGLARGATKLAGGLDSLADGTDQFADGMSPLATGIAKIAAGASQLSTGATGLSDGTSALAAGTSQTAQGAGELSEGLGKLADGGHQLATGTDKLADGLTKGADQVPTYDEATRERLASTVATPVSSPEPESIFSDVATTTFLAVIALWIGALATYLVLRAVPGSVVTSMKPSWRLAFEGLLPGAIIGALQAVALTVVLQILLDLSAAQVAALLPFAILTAVAFVAINYALVAWLGGVGRFISVALVVAAAAASITSAVPAIFDAIRPLLPLTPALEGFRAIASDGTGAAAAAGLLVAWLLVGLAASVLAVARRRVIAPLVAVPA
ncbi:MAG TPA: YhgE/Pip domain-containing protein [Propionibacteriaceae bacterium]|nr:YhgE/Pip domain-containing protein [Propionibacteriaceae bacterium]